MLVPARRALYLLAAALVLVVVWNRTTERAWRKSRDDDSIQHVVVVKDSPPPSPPPPSPPPATHRSHSPPPRPRAPADPAPSLEALLAAGPSTPDHVLVITSHFARPDFIRMQRYFFSRFLAENHTLIVVNDALEEPSYRNNYRADVRDSIAAEAASLGLVHVAVPPELHDKNSRYLSPGLKYQDPYNAAHRCAVAVQYAYERIVRKWKGLVLLLDSDMWPVAPLSVKEIINGTHMVGVKQYRSNRTSGLQITYMWNGLAFFNISSLAPSVQDEFSFKLGKVHGIPTDVGGWNHHFFEKYEGKGVNVRWIKYYKLHPCQLDPTLACPPGKKPLGGLIEATRRDNDVLMTTQYCREEDHCAEYCEAAPIFHYRSGGGWRKDQISLHERRVNLFDWQWMRNLVDQEEWMGEYWRYRGVNGRAKRVIVDWDLGGAGAGADAFLYRWNQKQAGNHSVDLAPPVMRGSGADCFSPAPFEQGKMPMDAWIVGRVDAGTVDRLAHAHPETNILTEHDVPGFSGSDGATTCPLETIVEALHSFYRVGDELYLRAAVRSKEELTCLERLLDSREIMAFKEICVGYAPLIKETVERAVGETRGRVLGGTRVEAFDAEPER